jgi:hypothetical protein
VQERRRQGRIAIVFLWGGSLTCSLKGRHNILLCSIKMRSREKQRTANALFR